MCIPLDSTKCHRGALERLVDEGHVRNLGVSNFGLSQIEDLLSWARIKPVVNQVELHPFLPQRKLIGGMLRKVRATAGPSPFSLPAAPASPRWTMPARGVFPCTVPKYPPVALPSAWTGAACHSLLPTGTQQDRLAGAPRR